MTLRRLRLPALALLLLASAGFRHDVHVTSARAVVEERVVVARVRFFHDDLQQALRAFSRQPALQLEVSPRADSVLTAYAAQHLVLRSGGRPLRLSLAGSGEEKGLKPELDIWWIDFRFDADRPLRGLDVTNELLFDQFRDQNNIMKFRLPDGDEKTVVFVPGEGTYRLKF